MKNYIFLIVICISLISCNSRQKSNSDIFYIRNQSDFDQYSGNVFPKGSKILFSEGTEFKGQFVIKGSGTGDNPNLVSSYNPKNKQILNHWTDKKAIINGQGKVEAPIFIRNGQHWEINNLEITNTNGSDDDQGKLKGIYVVAENSGIMENITN